MKIFKNEPLLVYGYSAKMTLISPIYNLAIIFQSIKTQQW